MKHFAELLDTLVYTPSRNGKLRILQDYVRNTPDPDRGLAVAALTGGLDIPSVKPAMLRALVAERVDEILFGYSYDFVGDLAETIALIWPTQTPPTPSLRSDLPHKGEGGSAKTSLSTIVHTLQTTSRSDAPRIIEGLLDTLDSQGRYALIKLVTGGLRIGVSARLVKQALAGFGGKDVTAIEELWHGLEPPYEELFAWLEGRANKPQNAAAAPFRPVMLAHPASEDELRTLDPGEFVAEWKWDGIRVQVTAERGVARIYSRTGDDISRSFPDLLEAMDFDASIDGELLVGKPGADGIIRPGTFGDLQQRLNRKTVSKKLLASHPVFVRAYDLLQDGADDLRALTYEERRARLERLIATLDPSRFDLSPRLEFSDWDTVAGHRAAPPDAVIEGVMLKRRDSSYVPGRPKGPWFKWKQDPRLVDCVLMYAQRGHGKRSSFYSDFTFGVWSGPEEASQLVPVGKAYFGFTDEELKQLDRYVRDNTVERFGPVRAVKATREEGLVLEIAFEGLNRSTRHKSGVAMRFPRISRLRWDKPAAEADRLETLEKMLE